MFDDSKITIITATLNSEKFLPRLIKSLESQTDKNFSWIISDGGSSDRTLSIIKACINLNVLLLQKEDFGIYDALNNAISKIDSGYYLVLGADDILFENSIRSYRDCLTSNTYDILTTAVIQNGKVIFPKSNLGWLFGLPGVSGHHAVGTLINIKLHKKFGFYSRKFPIAADQLFLKTAISNGADILRLTFVAGEFSTEGVSGTDHLGVITELFRVQVLTEKYHSIQYIIFLLRLSKLYINSLAKFFHSLFR